jgi:3,4-dihydroxy 2-butanone 4-phosphate synthase/GTP cyclohydrolase II
LTGDLLGSLRCDCGPQLHAALDEIAAAGKGVLLYIRQEGRGIGLANKLRAYKLQDEGLDTVEANEKLGYPADMRDYGIGAQILHDLGVRRMKLLTNNPKKLTGLAGYGLKVTAQIPISPDVQKHNAAYLKTKRDKMGHSLEL